MKRSVYIVEDDQDINDSLRTIFEDSGFQVNSYLNAHDFFKENIFPSESSYLIDWKLPDIQGIDVIKTIRGKNKVSPIFLMSASMESNLGYEALQTGADHFIRKPFNSEEVLLRFENALNKFDSLENHLIDVGIKLFPASHMVSKEGSRVTLTSREFSIFKKLFETLQVISRDGLLEEFSEAEEENKLTKRNIDVHIFSLRKKISSLGMGIETVWGRGYKLYV